MKMSSDKIQIITYFNQYHQILFDLYFLPTFNLYLEKNFELVPNYIDHSHIKNPQDYGYIKKIWQQIIVDRFDYIIEHIKKNIDEERISIFSDVDVVFFGDFYNDLKAFSNDQSLILWYMPETFRGPRYLINGGFFAFRHSYRTIEYFEKIKYLLSSNNHTVKNDQPIIQNFLKQTGASYADIMPSTIFSANNSGMDNNMLLLRNGSLKVFHATSTYCIHSKIIVLEKVIESIKPSILRHNKILS